MKINDHTANQCWLEIKIFFIIYCQTLLCHEIRTPSGYETVNQNVAPNGGQERGRREVTAGRSWMNTNESVLLSAGRRASLLACHPAVTPSLGMWLQWELAAEGPAPTEDSLPPLHDQVGHLQERSHRTWGPIVCACRFSVRLRPQTMEDHVSVLAQW